MPLSEQPALDRDAETHAIIGVAMEVHRNLGPGFLEAVYQEVMALELGWRSIPFMAQVPLPIFYRGHKLTLSYRSDFVCFGSVLVEIKALTKLSGQDAAQVINYLKASGMERALLINFGAQSLEFRRLMRTKGQAAKRSTITQITQITKEGD